MRRSADPKLRSSEDAAAVQAKHGTVLTALVLAFDVDLDLDFDLGHELESRRGGREISPRASAGARG